MTEFLQLIGRLEPLDDQLEGQLEEALQGSPDEAGEMNSTSGEREGSTAGTELDVEPKKSVREPQRRKRPTLTTAAEVSVNYTLKSLLTRLQLSVFT